MRSRVLATVPIIAALALSACGSSSKKTSTTAAPATTPPAATSTAPTSGASKVALSADPSGALKFDKSQATATAGNVTLTMANPSAVSHGIAIQGSGVSKTGAVVGQGQTSTVTVNLKPGTYTFYCPVPGHRQAGMQGTLTVK